MRAGLHASQAGQCVRGPPETCILDTTRILDWKIASMTTEIDLDRVGCVSSLETKRRFSIVLLGERESERGGEVAREKGSLSL